MAIAVWKLLLSRLGARSRIDVRDPSPILPSMMPRDLAAQPLTGR